MTRPGGAGPLGLRLALTFAGVALAAVATLAGLIAANAATDVSRLVTRQQTELASAVAAAAGAAWQRSDSWGDASLSPALDLAAQVGAVAQLDDETGRLVASSPGFSVMSGEQRTATVLVRGRRVGYVTLRFTTGGLGGADEELRQHLRRAIIGAAGLAVLLALLVALVVSRRITSPVARLIVAAQARGSGDRSARVGHVRGPAELRDLATAFDQMAESLHRQEAVQRNLVADVAHELRTPVAVLQAGHEALLDGVAEPTPEQLTSLRDEVLRLARMVDDLQELASAEAAALQLSPTPCDLAALADTAASRLADSFDAAGLQVIRRLTPVQVMGDSGRINEIATNLLTNALKFTPAPGSVLVEAGPQDHQATLRVSDTGVGIPPAELPHIFERFFRGDHASTVAGSGIGLTVVAELVQAHGGTLEVTSAPWQGTVFTVTLPRA